MQTTRFTTQNDGNPFKALAQAIHAQDVQKAKNLRKTQAARAANKRRAAEKAGR